MKPHPDNPFADKDGAPKPGKGWEYGDFEKEKELERRKSLPKEEVARLEAAEQHLAKKMNS